MSTNQTTAGEVIYRTNRRKFLGYLDSMSNAGAEGNVIAPNCQGGRSIKSPWIVHLAMFAMAVFGGVETAFADSIYSFTTIDVPGAFDNGAYGINDSGQIVGSFDDATGTHGFFLDVDGSFTTI